MLDAESVDAERHPLTRSQVDLRLLAESDARRGSGRDHVARKERHEVRDVRHQRTDAVDHRPRRPVLKSSIVDVEPESEVLRIRDFVLRHQPGAEGREPVVALALRLLTWLPLSHSYEHTVQFVQLTLGAKIFYSESLDKLMSNLKIAKPTIMTAVPRFYTNLVNKIKINLQNQSHLKKIIFQKTLQLGEKKVLGIQMSFFEKIINFILDLIVRKKIKNQFGGKIKAFISGGGPLDYNVGLFLNSLGLPTLQGYGLTEASPVVSCNPINKIKIDTVGKIFKDVSVNIASDGEILVKGENLMLGYWNNQIETEKIIKNGWLYTGDIGEIDNEGYLKITDRKKDIIVNAGGDNIAPSKIENLLANYPEIIQSYIYGDKKNYLVALIVVSKELEDRKNKIKIIIDKVNQELSIIEKIKKFIIIDDPFTIENQMLTPTMKIRRHQIKKVFGEQLEKLYF